MVSSVGMGGSPPPWVRQGPPSFQQLDANGDGSISLSELEDAGQSSPGGNSVSANRAQSFLKKVDTDGNGSISQDEFNAFQSNLASNMQGMMLQYQQQQTAGASGSSSGSQMDANIFAKIDTNGDGSISQSEFAAGTTKGAGGHHHHMHAGPPPGQDGQSAQDPLAQLLSSTTGASSTSLSNSDGSSTTTITYADGSKVSMTSAASPASGDNSNTSSSTQSNLLQQLIKLQAQLTGSATSTTSTTA